MESKGGNRQLDVGTMRALTLANRERGKESLGFFDSTGSIFKKGNDPIDVLATGECTEWLDRAENESWFTVGHTRFSTRGRVCDDNSHPFKYGSVIGAHNGIIDAPNSYTVDSQYAIDLLNQHNSNYQTALEAEYGYWTLAWYDDRVGELFISMHHNTCGLAKHRDRWYFSSDPDHLAAVLGTRETIILKEGGTVSFDRSGRMKWRKNFASNHSGHYKKDRRTSGGTTWKYSSGSGSSTSYNRGNGYTGFQTGGQQTSSTSTNGAIGITDPDGKVRDYDEEFRAIWAEYAAEYAD